MCDIQHECQRSSRLNVSIDELCQDIEANLRVCDGLDDADWKTECEGDEHGEKKRPPAEVGGISKYCVHAQSQHLYSNSQSVFAFLFRLYDVMHD